MIRGGEESPSLPLILRPALLRLHAYSLDTTNRNFKQLHSPLPTVVVLGSWLLKRVLGWNSTSLVHSEPQHRAASDGFHFHFLPAGITRHPSRAHSSQGTLIGYSDKTAGSSKIFPLFPTPQVLTWPLRAEGVTS